jgi:hypothetical protein
MMNRALHAQLHAAVQNRYRRSAASRTLLSTSLRIDTRPACTATLVLPPSPALSQDDRARVPRCRFQLRKLVARTYAGHLADSGARSDSVCVTARALHRQLQHVCSLGSSADARHTVQEALAALHRRTVYMHGHAQSLCAASKAAVEAAQAAVETHRQLRRLTAGTPGSAGRASKSTLPTPLQPATSTSV